MAGGSTPPLFKTLLAAAAGGFGGAVVGVLAAGMLTGDGDSDEPTSGKATDTQAVEVVVAER